MFERLFNAITKYDTIIIHRHGSPDGDAVGSQTGLKFLIKDNFPGKTVYTVGDAAGRYSFMEGSEADIVPDAAFCDALAVILDSAERGLVSDERYRTAAYSVRVDHHIYCDTFTDEEIVDTSFESCAGMIAEPPGARWVNSFDFSCATPSSEPRNSRWQFAMETMIARSGMAQ